MLEAISLTKRYGSRTAVREFSHRFAEGKITTILGPSGSGKSTTLALLAGLAEADGGKVLLDGRDITQTAPEARNFGLVFQNYLLFPHLNVLENVEFGLRVRRVPRGERRARALETLRLLRIKHLAERPTSEISGGEQQRVAMARALSFRPQVLLLDEPLSALDAKLREELRAELLRLQAELAVTTIYVTHDQVEAMSLGHEMIILNQGRIEQAGRPADLYLKPGSLFVANFLGDSNVFAAERDGDQVRLPFTTINVAANGCISRSCWAMLRPEALQLVDKAEADFSARLESCLFLGSRLRLQLRSGKERILIDADNRQTLLPEQKLFVKIRRAEVAIWPRDESAAPK